jgi:hypothetical protein
MLSFSSRFSRYVSQDTCRNSGISLSVRVQGLPCDNCYFDSNHPVHVKRGVVQSLVNRANLLCQNEQDLKAEMNTVRKELLSDACPTNFVGSVMCNKPVKEIKQKNSNGRFLGMVSIP